MSAAFEFSLGPAPEMSDTLVLSLRGRVDYHDAPELRDIVLRAIGRSNASVLIVDLAGMHGMDTAGMAVLVEGLMESRMKGRQMFLCAPSRSVLDIFHLAGLHEALDCCCASPGEVRDRMAGAGPRDGNVS